MPISAQSPTPPLSTQNSGGVAPRSRAKAALERLADTAREYARFDARLMRSTLGLAAVAASTGLRLAGKRARSLSLDSTIHRNSFSSFADRVVERRLHWTLAHDRGLIQQHVDELRPAPATEALFNDPARLLGRRILAVKSARPGEKGVLMLDYFFVFPLFARWFDVKTIASRYHIVLEPSWSGYFDLDLLCFAGLDFPVFVQNYEPRDLAFVERLKTNLISIPIAGNWWVDHRIFRPLPDTARDADVLLIAAWARYKRHEKFFAALARLRARGVRLRTVLVGYRGDLTRDDIFRLAHEYGVADQVEMYERLKLDEVNRQLNRVKANVLWSRREGFNRALIEGFFAGTPGILRHGFNFGYAYPYINPQTGAFATEESLPDTLLDVCRNTSRYTPRAWVLSNMSPQIATRIVDEAIGAYCDRAGENWTLGGLSVKTTALDQMSYWDEAERPKFEEDYAFLRSMLRAR
jgi:glycosyltransferase involved in cell wall biosynthesis